MLAVNFLSKWKFDDSEIETFFYGRKELIYEYFFGRNVENLIGRTSVNGNLLWFMWLGAASME